MHGTVSCKKKKQVVLFIQLGQLYFVGILAKHPDDRSQKRPQHVGQY